MPSNILPVVKIWNACWIDAFMCILLNIKCVLIRLSVGWTVCFHWMLWFRCRTLIRLLYVFTLYFYHFKNRDLIIAGYSSTTFRCVLSDGQCISKRHVCTNIVCMVSWVHFDSFRTPAIADIQLLPWLTVYIPQYYTLYTSKWYDFH